ncbi:aminotransferase class I/II-fold pyridoxal phosphate-dependent enzyme [Metabacillus bambusae]|uniref:Aminotransferase class I/II-fold pyridoxal phosphate-dependent enzyme n=1 Tax=Metabacillus bambusae TaxID=2795218 RepID=A0ABS3N9Y1_9BACI|nr:aminotransferase class I/II-fold pyridoxal phosphate-dependent enzyme [Metabacillus bambusae]MBO1515100.1 aminotransferase class I/II-fold pyridoxal phosphate-dependent enzyme [Metabacillus bambusae]
METPLFTALMQHTKRNPLSLHVPGHKNGTIFMNQAEQIYRGILPFDVTELTGLDDLHHPKEAIAKAQQLTATLYGVQNTYFLVNGSTVGNLAMILASSSKNDEVLVQRNSHKSIINGIQLAGASPIFLSPKVDNEYQVPSYVEIETIKEAIRRYPKAKALILTNPNYYGLTIDLTAIIQLAHKHRIPVLVDEAHGAHFIAGNEFPTSAIESGADIVVHSAHKTLPAMTMGSFLHFNSKLIDKEKLDFYLSVLQSSSPSYPIMASLDLARAYLKGIKEDKKQGEILQAIESVKQQIHSIDEIDIVRSTDKLVRTDPLKVTIRSTNGLTGFELQDYFESQNIFAELADPTNLLFILPLANTIVRIDELEKIKGKFPNPSHSTFNRQLVHSKISQSNSIQPLEKPYSYLNECERKLVAFDEAIGYYSAESIIPYPPGIPFIMIGETITTILIEQLTELIKSGVSIQGDRNIQQGKLAIFMKRR